MSMYNGFALYYDALMQDCDYERWTSRILQVIQKELPSAHAGIDLACGSGNFTIPLADAGYAMIGADPSEEMLTEAAAKSGDRKITYLCCKAQDMILDNQADFVTMMCDGVNYCVDGLDFKTISNLLKPEGLFIFDISGYKHIAETLGNNLYFEDLDEVTYFWQNEFLAEKDLLTMNLTFFVPQEEEELYSRFDETHYLRAYRIDDLLRQLKPYFQVQVLNGDLNGDADDDCRRIHFICRKK